MWNLLEVLPGWPEAEPVSDLFLFLLMIGAPVATLAVFSLIGWAPKLARQARESRSQELAASDR